MSREVDLSTPLTKEERAYLHMRGRIADIERADAQHGVTEADPFIDGDGTGPQQKSVLTGDRAAARKAELLAELAALEESESDEDEDTSDVEDEDGEDGESYADWTVPQLDAELAKRKLAKGGTKDDKVRRLEEDDETNA